MTKARYSIASIALGAFLAGAADAPFRPAAAASYAHQMSEDVTVGAAAFSTEELTSQAFPKKADFLKYGVLPILVVIENRRNLAVDISNLQVELVATDGRHGSPISPDEVMHLAETGKNPPKLGGSGPLPIHLPKKKNPFNAPEIVERAFTAKVVPAHDSASGFFYFEARPEPGDSLYLSGMRDPKSSRELLYVEFPLNSASGK